MDIDPRAVAAAGLLAILPAAAYAATQPDTIGGVVAAANAVLITASLALALAPVDRGAAMG